MYVSNGIIFSAVHFNHAVENSRNENLNDLTHENQNGTQNKSQEKTQIETQSENVSQSKSPNLVVDEIQQVIFAKVHKAASSTLQNILLRFAMARELDVLLPRAQDHINEFGPKIDPRVLIEHARGQQFNILCNHLVFNAQEVAAYIPSSAFRFGILRDPLSQALSALQYYTTYYLNPGTTMWSAVRKYARDPVKGFLDNPHEFCNERSAYETQRCTLDNRMSMDLGFDTSRMFQSKRNKTKIQEFVSQIERQFDLMLISEYFDESMVLLRRYLHWQMKDIIYLRVNAAVAENKSKYVWRRDVQPDTIQLRTFKQWAAVDIALYEHFLPEFLKKIKKEHLFHEEVAAFKEIRSNVADFCKNPRNSTGQVLNIPDSRWTQKFSVSVSDCEVMRFAEAQIVQKARIQQLARFYRSQRLS